MPERRRRNERDRHGGCQREIGKAWAVVMLLLQRIEALDAALASTENLAGYHERFALHQQDQLDELRKGRSDG